MNQGFKEDRLKEEYFLRPIVPKFILLGLLNRQKLFVNLLLIFKL